MPSPKLSDGYILLETSHTAGNESDASTIKGAFKYGRTVEKFPMVDMVVEGSVAVDKYGGRLGKGGGYGDMEISCLDHQKVIGLKTPIVSTVHEIQILERVPLESHDKKNKYDCNTRKDFENRLKRILSIGLYKLNFFRILKH